jgi:palmitoyltransferase
MWWNIFSSKACQLLRALGTVMVLIVLGVIGLTYYTTVVVVYGPLAGQDNSDGKFAKGVLVVYHALILMVLWSYFACVLTEPGRVPDSWQPPPEVGRDVHIVQFTIRCILIIRDLALPSCLVDLLG